MRNNFHYGFGARLTAVILTLLMILSVSGLTLRGQGGDGPEIFPESYGTPVPEETAAPEATEEPAESTETPVPEATETPRRRLPPRRRTAARIRIPIPASRRPPLTRR